MAYSKTLVLIPIWYFQSKYRKTGALVKGFYKYIKASLALIVKKSVAKGLTFIKLNFWI